MKMGDSEISWDGSGDEGRCKHRPSKRENQITFCRSLIVKHGCDISWDHFVASMTPDDRMNLHLTGLNTYQVLKREFSGMVNDDRRAREDARIEERAKLLAASLRRCAVRLLRAPHQ